MSTESAAVHHVDIESEAATKHLFSDLMQIDAQAVYQIALVQLRLHRNRWKAPDPTQDDPSPA